MATNSFDTISTKDYKIFESIYRNDFKALEEAIEKGGNPNYVDYSAGTTPLLIAVMSGKSELVELLINKGANVNLADPQSGASPLSFALSSAPEPVNEKTVKFLLDAGADTYWKHPELDGNDTVIKIAQMTGNDAVIKMVLGARAKQKKSNESDSTKEGRQVKEILSLSESEIKEIIEDFQSGHMVGIMKSIEKIAQASASGNVKKEWWALLTKNALEGLEKSGISQEKLAQAFTQKETQKEYWSSRYFKFEVENDHTGKGSLEGCLFDIACARGDNEQVEFWIKILGPEWNPRPGLPGLSWAINENRNSTVDLLLKWGANPNGVDASLVENGREEFNEDWDTPLHLALVNDNIPIALSLLKSGARATGTDYESFTEARKKINESQRREVVDSIGAMLSSDDLEVASRAVGAWGALDVHDWLSEKDYKDYLPQVHIAFEKFGEDWREACQNQLSYIDHLPAEFKPVLSHQNVNNETYSGSILDRACATGRQAATEFLSTCVGGNWNPDGEDRPIDWASNVGDAHAIEVLVKNGALLEDEQGRSPLTRAIAGGWADAARALIDYGADPSCLSVEERAVAYALIGKDKIDEVCDLGIEMAKSSEPEESFYGLRQILNLAKVEWVSDWNKATQALDEIGFEPHLEKSNGKTQFGDSVLREGGYIGAQAEESNPLKGNSSILALYAYKGDLDATRFLSRALGANFRLSDDNGSALANAVAGNQMETARLLISLGAQINTTPNPLAIAASMKNYEIFLMLATEGASADSLKESDFQNMKSFFKTNKTLQRSLIETLKKLPLENAGFDSLLVDGVLPSSFASALVKAGQKERFWSLREKIDWTSDVSDLVETAKEDKEVGLAAYASFRRAMAGDDINEAISAIESTPAMLSSLAKRGLVDEVILASLGAGRSKLMKAMADAEWPMELTMREHAAEALMQAAASKDLSMFEHLLPMAPSNGSITVSDQAAIARAAWKLGGQGMLLRLDEQIGGINPEVIETCRDLFMGIEGDKTFASLALAAIEREANRSRALDRQVERVARRKAIFALTSSHWSSFSEEQKLKSALGIASWNEAGFWERATKKMANMKNQLNSMVDGEEAFFAFCFQNRSTARTIFTAAKEESLKELAKAAQMASATSNDADLAALATLDTGVPSSEEAILTAAKLDNGNALKSLLSRVEGSSMKGLLSKALIPTEAEARSLFMNPVLESYELPANSCRELADAGATFAKEDLEGEGAKLLTDLAARAQNDKVSAERERSFSVLALRGVLPESLWMPKEKIIAREPRLLALASDEDKNNAQIVMAAVKVDGMVLSLAGPLARATLAVVSEACNQTSDAIHAVSPILIQAMGLTEDNCKTKLEEAMDAAESTFNPLKMLKKKAALSAQKTAQEIAKNEMDRSAKARALDFVPLERALVDARLKDNDRSLAEMALTRSKAIRASFERSGTVSNLDLNDLRRLVEKNLPSLLSKFAAVDPALRDTYDESSRSTPNKMLRSGLADALTEMENIASRADEGARIALKGESVVLAAKASSANILAQRRAEGAAQVKEDDEKKVLKDFGDHVDAAIGVASENAMNYGKKITR